MLPLISKIADATPTLSSRTVSLAMETEQRIVRLAKLLLPPKALEGKSFTAARNFVAVVPPISFTRAVQQPWTIKSHNGIFYVINDVDITSANSAVVRNQMNSTLRPERRTYIATLHTLHLLALALATTVSSANDDAQVPFADVEDALYDASLFTSYALTGNASSNERGSLWRQLNEVKQNLPKGVQIDTKARVLRGCTFSAEKFHSIFRVAADVLHNVTGEHVTIIKDRAVVHEPSMQLAIAEEIKELSGRVFIVPNLLNAFNVNTAIQHAKGNSNITPTSHQYHTNITRYHLHS